MSEQLAAASEEKVELAASLAGAQVRTASIDSNSERNMQAGCVLWSASKRERTLAWAT